MCAREGASEICVRVWALERCIRDCACSGSAADLEMMAERKENVESQDEIVVAVEQLPDSLDHVRSVDRLSLELHEELEKLLV